MNRLGLARVILLLMMCVKCWTMSRNEIEDFSNFLRRTSVLDQSLKDGFGSDDRESDDVEEVVSDDAWEQSGRFEGDLILNDRQRRLIVEDVAEGLSRNGLKDSTKRWPDNEVTYYIQKEHFNEEQLQAIQEGMEDLARASCIKFKPYQKGDRDAVVIQGSRRGCFSQVGYQSGFQVLNLSARHPVGRGCFRHGTVVHELLHTLGFFHMQSSPDRDDYIDVVWDNIVQPARHNFKKYNTFSVSDFGVGYDYESVLHYGRRAFSNNGRDTLVPKKSGAEIGQRIGLSDKDTQKLNKMYCDADSNNYDEEDVANANRPIHKKKPLPNQPFQGHGIGYHQGKTLVIKLPAAETFALPDKKIHKHSFDYFSKSPQAVLSTAVQGARAGEKVNQNPTQNSKDHFEDFIKEMNAGHDYKYSVFAKDEPFEDIGSTISKSENQTSVSKSNENVSRDDSPEESVSVADDDMSSREDVTDYFADWDKIIKDKIYNSDDEHEKYLHFGEDFNNSKEYGKQTDSPWLSYSKPSYEESVEGMEFKLSHEDNKDKVSVNKEENYKEYENFYRDFPYDSYNDYYGKRKKDRYYDTVEDFNGGPNDEKDSKIEDGSKEITEADEYKESLGGGENVNISYEHDNSMVNEFDVIPEKATNVNNNSMDKESRQLKDNVSFEPAPTEQANPVVKAVYENIQDFPDNATDPPSFQSSPLKVLSKGLYKATIYNSNPQYLKDDVKRNSSKSNKYENLLDKEKSSLSDQSSPNPDSALTNEGSSSIEIGKNLEQQDMKPINSHEESAKMVRHTNDRKIKKYFSNELDDGPFQFVKPVHYEVIQYLPYDTAEYLSRDYDSYKYLNDYNHPPYYYPLNSYEDHYHSPSNEYFNEHGYKYL